MKPLLLISCLLLACADSSGLIDGNPDAGLPDVDAEALPLCPADSQMCADDCCLVGEVCAFDAFCVDDEICNGNDDCQDDSYCDPDLELCIPYDEGFGEAVDESCENEMSIGVFAPGIQCEWAGPPPGDPYPTYRNVLGTPVVIDFDFDSDPSTIRPSIAFVSYNGFDGSTPACRGSDTEFGVIRVIDGETCEQIALIDSEKVVAAAPLATADLDGDSDKRPEIVTHRVGGGMAAFKWNESTGLFETHWVTQSRLGEGLCLWSGPSIHDLDDDGVPEVLMGGGVFDGVDGSTIDESLGLLVTRMGQIPVVADLDGDGAPDLATGAGIYSWDALQSRWLSKGIDLGIDGLVAVADFGSYPTVGVHDRSALDGVAEVVVVARGLARVMSIHGELLFGPVELRYFAPSTVPGSGGPPTIADFDGDGRVEFSVAGRGGYTVFDADCVGTPDPAFCNTGGSDGVLWAMPTQDYSSSITGSSVFDFEGDGRAEVVYADECFSRVYDGLGGEILYSAYRTSCTWYENPVVADVDGDFNSEIVIPSNANCNIECPSLDPLFDGLRCETDADCPGTTSCGIEAGGTLGFCRCSLDADCGGNGFVCQDPIAGPSALGQVCRAGHPGNDQTGIRVVRDALDRWVNSRPIWNQHAYAVTNVDDRGQVPQTSSWLQNWKQPGLNNFRQNTIGDPELIGSPDLTARGERVSCATDVVKVSASLCNRGTEAVAPGAAMSFYEDAPGHGPLICTVQSSQVLQPGECEELSCTWAEASSRAVTAVADDPGLSGAERNSECHENNNTSRMPGSNCVGVL